MHKSPQLDTRLALRGGNINRTLAKQYALDSLKFNEGIETNRKIDSLINIQHRQELLLKKLTERMHKSPQLSPKHKTCAK